MHQYSDQLLLPYTHSSNLWCNTDSLELYQLNLTRQHSSWYYGTHAVNYTWNSNGYRCAEWSDITWSQSHVIMGCSYALGLGITDSDCVAAHLENGVNLAQPAVSVYHIQYNTLRLLGQGHRPRRVDIIVPELTRSVYWGNNDWVDITIHDFESRSHELTDSVQQYYRGYVAQPPNAELCSYMTILGVQALWRSQGVDCVLWSLWIHGDQQFDHRLADPIDWARDLDAYGTAHPGRQTHRLWAEQILATM